MSICKLESVKIMKSAVVLMREFQSGKAVECGGHYHAFFYI